MDDDVQPSNKVRVVQSVAQMNYLCVGRLNSAECVVEVFAAIVRRWLHSLIDTLDWVVVFCCEFCTILIC